MDFETVVFEDQKISWDLNVIVHIVIIYKGMNALISICIYKTEDETLLQEVLTSWWHWLLSAYMILVSS